MNHFRIPSEMRSSGDEKVGAWETGTVARRYQAGLPLERKSPFVNLAGDAFWEWRL